MIAARRPRVCNSAYIAWLHELPCVVTGHIGDGVQSAHIRFADFAANKDLTGMGRRPDDHWCLPLHQSEHLQRQHKMNERAYWSGEGKDPLALCNRLSALYPDTEAATVMILAQIKPARRWK